MKYQIILFHKDPAPISEILEHINELGWDYEGLIRIFECKKCGYSSKKESDFENRLCRNCEAGKHDADKERD